MTYGLMTRGAMKMSRHYRGHHHHRGGYHGGGDIISLIIGLFFYIFILIFQVIKACFDWGTARSKAVGFGIIGAIILIYSLIKSGVSSGIIAGLIIFFVILFFVLMATMDGSSQSSAASVSSSQRNERQSMLNQYSKDPDTVQVYMQDDIHDLNFYHHHFHEKADFDDQFAEMEAQVHSVNDDDEEADFEGTGYSWGELADMDIDEREEILEEEGVHEDMWDEF